MAKIRLGKAERAIVKAYWDNLRSKRRALVQSNLSGPKPESVRFSSVRPLEGSMIHGIYREQITKEGFRKGDSNRVPKLSKGGFASERTPMDRKNPELKRPWYVSKDAGHKVV